MKQRDSVSATEARNDSWREQAWLLKKSLQWKLPKLGDQKCIPTWRKSFIVHPSASSFQGEDAERVFNSHKAIS
jgi:hypothetical protein